MAVPTVTKEGDVTSFSFPPAAAGSGAAANATAAGSADDAEAAGPETAGPEAAGPEATAELNDQIKSWAFGKGFSTVR